MGGSVVKTKTLSADKGWFRGFAQGIRPTGSSVTQVFLNE